MHLLEENTKRMRRDDYPSTDSMQQCHLQVGAWCGVQIHALLFPGLCKRSIIRVYPNLHNGVFDTHASGVLPLVEI